MSKKSSVAQRTILPDNTRSLQDTRNKPSFLSISIIIVFNDSKGVLAITRKIRLEMSE